jgi:ferredoxin
VINPDDCIDCGSCVAECPVEAIYPENEMPEFDQSSIWFNASNARKLKDEGAEPITEQQDPLPNADKRKKSLGY